MQNTHQLYVAEDGTANHKRCLSQVQEAKWPGDEEERRGQDDKNRLFENESKVKAVAASLDSWPEGCVCGRRAKRRGSIHGECVSEMNEMV